MTWPCGSAGAACLWCILPRQSGLSVVSVYGRPAGPYQEPSTRAGLAVGFYDRTQSPMRNCSLYSSPAASAYTAAFLFVSNRREGSTGTPACVTILHHEDQPESRIRVAVIQNKTLGHDKFCFHCSYYGSCIACAIRAIHVLSRLASTQV